LDVLNKEFDPTEAEAVEIVPGEKDNIVTEVIRKGYKFAGKVLRVALVKVSKTQMSNPKTQSQ
jgi:molecular chaperone GrpE (heat shock protein)